MTLSNQEIDYSHMIHSRDCIMHCFYIGMLEGIGDQISLEHILNIDNKLPHRYCILDFS